MVGGHGFLDTDGSFTTIDVPGAIGTGTSGINNSGQIVGVYLTVENFSFVSHGFLDTGGSFTTIDVPGAAETQAQGINDSGQIVGQYYNTATGFHGFLDTGGSFTTIDAPGASTTLAEGINDSGQIVGSRNGQLGAFLATPTPEPRTLLPVLTACLIGLCAMSWRRKHAREAAVTR